MTTSTYVLMATYNGAAYLAEQLESLRQQTFADFRLLVRDDGSTDATRRILADAIQYDDRIELVSDNLGRLGAAHNFGELLRIAYVRGACYAAFADQDDVWHNDKLAKQLRVLKDIEAGTGRATAALVHTDLTVVDHALRGIHPSLKAFARQHRDPADIGRGLLIGNHVTGCAMIVNRALMAFALPFPERIVMHDWWLAQCAAMVGVVSFLDEPTMLYRLHQTNTVGAESVWHKFNVLRPDTAQRWRRSVSEFAVAIEQVRALRSRLAERAPAGTKSLDDVDLFLNAVDADDSLWGRWTRLREAGFDRAGPLNQAVLAAKLWSLPGRAA